MEVVGAKGRGKKTTGCFGVASTRILDFPDQGVSLDASCLFFPLGPPDDEGFSVEETC